MTSAVAELLTEVRPAWKLPKKITVSEWADAHRVLPESSAEPGRWRTSRTPYLKGPMDALNDPHVREITLMMSTQVGKTETMLNMVGYIADEDPGPTAWLGAKEQDVKDFCVERLQPIFNLSSELLSKLSKNKDEINKKGIALDNMRLHVVWAGSPAGLASRAIKYILADEVDKYPPYSGRESDPIELISERTRTFWSHKKVKCSTPTTKRGYIYKEYEKSDKRKYYMPCPYCGEYQTFAWGCVKFPKNERDPDVIKMNRLAWYECPHCGEKITDSMKQRMLENGIWVPGGGKIDKNGKVSGIKKKSIHAGFWLNALYSPWLTFSDVAAKFLSVKDEPSKLMNFVNSWLAEVWEEKAKEIKKDHVKKKVAKYVKGVVPDSVLVLTAAVDVQKLGFYYVIRGWGYDKKSWLIRADKAYSWEEVALNIFNTFYSKADESSLPVRLVFVDTGYKTHEAYDFCRLFPDRAIPVKGRDTLNGEMFKDKKLDRYPNGQPMPGGLILTHLDNEFFKDKLHGMIHADDQWHLYKSPSDEYFRHMVGEHKVPIRDKKTGTVKSENWEKTGQNVSVDYWDCEVYATAAAQRLGVDLLTPDNKPRVYKAEKNRDNRTNWIGQHENWLK